jgi:hypothetical protein
MPADSPLLLGIRHHGPGSARAVRRVLEAYRPEVVLVEGPPEADALVALAGSEQMQPPVALLAYRPTGAGERPPATFWPFAEFSPEWQAIRWAVDHEVPVRFCDLPAAHGYARADADESTMDSARADPIAALAEAAGYDDPERWWEDVVEHQRPDARDLASALAPFEAIATAMAAVRGSTVDSTREQRREAAMRTALRTASKQYVRVVVVCGAWHVPALTAPLPSATSDAALLRGLPKTKVNMTWVPWTHGRLASWQGYGAGVTSPGWYHHLFTEPDQPVARWLVAVARLLRTEGQTVSSAHVIEAVRLAEALSVLRGRPYPGLSEVTEATRAVLCDGEELRVRLVNQKMVVGEQLGAVPGETPSVPLVTDVAATQRRLRLKPSPLVSEQQLDLRRVIDLERSQLLHRLVLLGVRWGEPGLDRRGLGTFWEPWRLQWHPDFAVDLIEASAYGTTVATAATAKAAELASKADTLAAVTELVQRCLLADLPDAWPVVLQALADRVALDADVTHLMAALPALARTLRYGDVRGTDVASVRDVAHGLVVRICIGLPGAVTGLDDDAAAAMREYLDGVQSALGLLADAALSGEWEQTLIRLADRDDLPGIIGGRIARLLLDGGQLSTQDVGRRMGLMLTIGVPPARAAAWVEGFLGGGGLLLVHDERLLSLVDGWLRDIPADTFVEVLPLLRRTFGTFAGPERRAIGERVRRVDSGESTVDSEALDRERAALVLPTIHQLLGREVLL